MGIFVKLKKKYDSLPIEVKAVIWYTACNMAQKAIGVLVVPILTRLFTTSEYGVYSVFISWLEIFEIIVTLRLSAGAYIVGLVKFEDDKYKYTASLESLTLVITTFFLGIYWIFRDFVNSVTDLDTSLSLLLFGLLYITPIINFWKAWERVANQYIPMVMATLATTFFAPFFGIVLILAANGSVNQVIGARVFVEFMVALIITIRFYQLFLCKPKAVYWIYALKTNVPLIPYYLSTTVLNHSDRILIQQIIGKSEAGIYSVAYSVAMIMQLFSSAFNSSLQPWLYKCLKTNKTEEIANTINLATFFVAAVNLAVIYLAPEIVRFFAPKEYYEAIWVIPPITASVLVMYIYQQYINIEFYYEEGKLTAIASIGAAVLNIFLNIVFIPVFGYFAAGYTTLISYLVFAIVHYFFMIKVCKKNNQRQDLLDIKVQVLVFLVFVFVSIIAMLTYYLMVIRYVILLFSLLIVIRKKEIIFQNIKLIMDKKKR